MEVVLNSRMAQMPNDMFLVKTYLNVDLILKEDTRECHSTCSYGPKSRYPNTSNKCAPCAANCFKCSDSNKCQECSYTKKRFSGSVTPANFITKSANGQIDPATDCIEGNLNKDDRN